MNINVNLLPLSYRQAKARRRRIRFGAAVASVLLATELFAGLMLHARAGRVRDLLAAAQTAREATQSVRVKMRAPRQESSTLAQQLALAKKLRSTHHWSRLLGVYANATEAQVTLTAVSTNPPRWTPALSASEAEPNTAKRAGDAPRLIEGLTVRGCASEHEDVSNFIKRLQAADAFASLNLLDVRRDKYLEQDVISFEIQCRW